MARTRGTPRVRPRRDERIKAQNLRCALGEVVDLSASGMRIRVKGKPPFAKGDVQTYRIDSSSQRLTLQAAVMWIRRCGVLSKDWELGVRFTDQRDSIRKAIEEFARMGFVQRDASGRTAGAQQTQAKPDQPAISASVEVEDLYAVLGVARTDSPETIRTVFRKLAMQLHPDRSAEPDAEARFARIDKAYTVLRDPELRARYDAMLDEARAA